MTQACLDGLSDSVANMQSTANPYVSGTESQATSGAGELQRLRFMFKQLFGLTNWYRHDQPLTLAHTSVLRFAHSIAGTNSQYSHVTALRLSTTVNAQPNSFGFWEGNDQILLGHEGATLKVVGAGASHIALGARGYVALGRHTTALGGLLVPNALYAATIPKAFLTFTADPTVNAPTARFNVASVAATGTGQYVITWERAFPDAAYSVVATPVGANAVVVTVEALATTHAVVRTWSALGTPGTAANSGFSLQAIGAQ